MTKVTSPPKLQCPNCQSPAIRRSQRRGSFERILSLFRILPYRCEYYKCGIRFYIFPFTHGRITSANKIFQTQLNSLKAIPTKIKLIVLASGLLSLLVLVTLTFPRPKSNVSEATQPLPNNQESLTIYNNTLQEAVNTAEAAVKIAKSAKSKQEWEIVASLWENASSLMRKVPTSEPKYQIAQQRAIEYRKNLDYARKKINNLASK